jgi:hypothetical protein
MGFVPTGHRPIKSRHFYQAKEQGFIYENAQKKVLENCNFCPGKSLKSP